MTHVPTLAPTPFPTFSTTEASEEPKTDEEVESVPEEHVVTAVPTLAPTEVPISTPTLEPSAKPSMEPTLEPVAHPTREPRADPTRAPTIEPTEKDPVPEPTPLPTDEPIPASTDQPTREPTAKPSMEPTLEPVAHPTNHPIALPTRRPVSDPTEEPTMAPNDSLERFEEREEEKAEGDIEPEPEWIQGDEGNETAPEPAPEPEQDDGEEEEVDTSPPPQGAGNDQVFKENIGDYANICMMNNIPVSHITAGMTVNPGCVLLSNKDLTTAQANPQYEAASIVTICSTRPAGDVIIDSDVLSDFDLIFEGDALAMSIGLGDDTQTTVFKDERARGDVFKRFLGAPARDKKYDFLYSLANNKYMQDGSTIGGNVFSVELKTSVETLSDGAATIENSDVTQREASKKHLALFKEMNVDSNPSAKTNKSKLSKKTKHSKKH